MELRAILDRIDALKAEIDALRPIDPEQEARVMQMLRIDWNYHSNAIEGNTLTLGETRAFLLHGITAKGKPFRDYLDIKGHNEAIAYLEEMVRGKEPLTEVVIRELHRILLVEPYDVDAVTADGRPTRRRIAIGQYKTAPNHVRTSMGEIHYYATPEETPAHMGDLMAWHRRETKSGALHPLLLAATFHYRFVAIHPFDDGNGRMARLLMNLILMQCGYVPIVIRLDSRADYLLALETADAGELGDFVALVGEELIRSLALFLKAAKNQDLQEPGAFEQSVLRLREHLASYDA
jgi:Fic family protein